MNNVRLTPASHDLFMALANMGHDWSGCPLVELSRAERGNLTHLKVNGLLTTMESDGDMFVYFTRAGADYAAAHGFDMPDFWIP